MQLHGNTTKKIAFLGFMITVALILSYVESIVPLSFSVPGIKLGLANLCTVILLYRYGGREAFTVNVIRIILVGFLFGSMSMIMYSLAGALFSFLWMIAIKRIKLFSVCGVSIVGGVTHNIGQLIVAAIVVSNFNILLYLPVLIAAGAITGFVIGIVSNTLLPILNRTGM